MLSRRQFLAGACCVLHAGPAAAAQAKQRSYICGATHPPPLGFAPPGGIPLAGAALNPHQVWRPEHGATPKSDVVTLNVHFMNGPRSYHRDVERVANEWTSAGLEKRVQFRFGRRRAESQVR
jgi:hypothetical protein